MEYYWMFIMVYMDEKNKRNKQHVSRPVKVVFKEIIKNTSLSFDSEYYKKIFLLLFEDI